MIKKKTKEEIKEIREAFPSEEADYIIKNIEYGKGEKELDG
jgi:uncharacterized protein YeeX (DUF496 family)